MEYHKLLEIIRLDLTATAKYLYICLYIISARGNNTIKISNRGLAKVVNMASKTVFFCKKQLVVAGLIEVITGRGGADSHPDVIKVVK